jgi:tetratricopeptide (TPR) repeat protein
MVNLQARTAFLAGDGEGAIRLAQEALSLNREERDDAERANSSRILADAQLALGNAAAAAEAYADAIALDKRLGLGDKLVLDLSGLGRAAQAQGRGEEARGWFERARAAARAAGDEAGAATAEALLEALSRSR